MPTGTLAVAGHGATLAVELDPVGQPDVYTVIAEMNGDIVAPTLTRPETNVTGHDHTIDRWVISGVIEREPLQFTVNWVFDHPTHDHLTGMLKSLIDNECRKYQFRGPGGTTDTDEWLFEAYVTSIGQTNPVRTGVRTSPMTLRLTGPMTIDGVAVGT